MSNVDVDEDGLPLLPAEWPLKPNPQAPAAKYNARILSEMSRLLQEEPEMNILTAIPSHYEKQFQYLVTKNPKSNKKRKVLAPRDTRSLLREDDVATVISPLSNDVQSLIDEILVSGCDDVDTSEAKIVEDPLPDDVSAANREVSRKRKRDDEIAGDMDIDNNDVSDDLKADNELAVASVALLERSEVLFQYPYGFSTMVLKVNDNTVVKLVRDIDNTTEYSTLEYLQVNAPNIPGPRPKGMIQMGRYYLVFSSFIPGEDLDKVWPTLEEPQKKAIMSKIDALFTELRQLRRPADKPLGGVGGEGCKDTRRDTRVSTAPIMTVAEFEKFVFTSPRPSQDVWVDILKGFIPKENPEPRCVFTHGDLRPANIRVQKNDEGEWDISGIIDWEFSGFYPEYWEAIKVTNTLSPVEQGDWYQHLPRALSPYAYPTRWLLDRLWDPIVA